MKHLLLTLAVAGLAPCLVNAAEPKERVTEPTFTEWHDLSVNNVNRFATRTSFFAYENREAALKGNRDKSSNFLSIEGDWRFQWVENADQRPTDFFRTDYNDAAWKNMRLPSRRSSQLSGTSISACFRCWGYSSTRPVIFISGYRSENSCMDRSRA